MAECCFFLSPGGDAYENLARDELILNELAPGRVALYLYVNNNAVIIGRNQNPYLECDLKRMDEDGVQLVRRVSGGGAVYHDGGNLNYSFIAPGDLYDEARQTGVVLKALKALGVQAEVSGRNDISCGGLKFSGNAFAARGENRQHHGTLLIASDLSKLSRYLTPSRLKLEAKGIKSVRARVCNLSEIVPGLSVSQAAQALKDAFREEYGAPDALSFDAGQEARLEALKQKHASRAWLKDETPAFDVSFEGRVSWGQVRLMMNVRQGAIAACRVYSDSLDTALPQRIAVLGCGARFERDALSAALASGGAQAEELLALINIAE